MEVLQRYSDDKKKLEEYADSIDSARISSDTSDPSEKYYTNLWAASSLLQSHGPAVEPYQTQVWDMLHSTSSAMVLSDETRAEEMKNAASCLRSASLQVMLAGSKAAREGLDDSESYSQEPSDPPRIDVGTLGDSDHAPVGTWTPSAWNSSSAYFQAFPDYASSSIGASSGLTDDVLASATGEAFPQHYSSNTAAGIQSVSEVDQYGWDADDDDATTVVG